MPRVTYKNRVLLNLRSQLREETGLERLRRAVTKIDEALAEQRAEVAEFRKTMLELQDAVERMEDGWRDYDCAIRKINVAPLGRRARRLARIMSTV